MKTPNVLIPKPRFYIAYGSNLCQRDMRWRAPDAVPRGRLILDNARLVFRGVADVECEIGHQAQCGLWEISKRDEEALDRYEGVDGGLYCKDEIDIGRGEWALIYTMTATGVYPPSDFYVKTIRQGYRDFGLDQSFLDAAILHSFKRKEPCEQTTARRERQKKTQRYRRLVPVPEALAMKKLARRLKKEDIKNDNDICG